MRTIDKLQGNIVDLHAGEIVPGTVVVEDGHIAEIRREPGAEFSSHVLPGFVDGHLHVESSMLPPPEFARLAMARGTVAVVADPHEIGNVLGVDGVRYMLEAGEKSPLKFYFGAPSCVPATSFETAGATIDAAQVDDLLSDPRILFLSEVMNWPGVLSGDPEVMAKLAAAKQRGKLIDGHAPGLKGEAARKYAAAGITTDHESCELDEALDKIAAGMMIGIREGSAAKNLDALLPLVKSHTRHCFFCTDDSHPDDLLHGHIDRLVRRALAAGYDPIDVLRVACLHAVEHYGLAVGTLRVGDPADFIEVDGLEQLNILRTVIDGRVVAEEGKALSPPVAVPVVNRFQAGKKTVADFQIRPGGGAVRVIEARDGQLVTGEGVAPATVQDGVVVPDVESDILENRRCQPLRRRGAGAGFHPRVRPETRRHRLVGGPRFAQHRRGRYQRRGSVPGGQRDHRRARRSGRGRRQPDVRPGSEAERSGPASGGFDQPDVRPAVAHRWNHECSRRPRSGRALRRADRQSPRHGL